MASSNAQLFIYFTLHYSTIKSAVPKFLLRIRAQNSQQCSSISKWWRLSIKLKKAFFDLIVHLKHFNADKILGQWTKSYWIEDSEVTEFSCTSHIYGFCVCFYFRFYLTVNNDSFAVLHHGAAIRGLNGHRNFTLHRKPCYQTVLQGQLWLSKAHHIFIYLCICLKHKHI